MGFFTAVGTHYAVSALRERPLLQGVPSFQILLRTVWKFTLWNPNISLLKLITFLGSIIMLLFI